MLKVNTGDQKIDVNWRRLPNGTGEGPTVFNIPGGAAPPPVVSNGILLEDNTSFLLLEDNTSILLLEA
jgi:hypothetical protein